MTEIPYWGSGMLHTVLGHCDLDIWPKFLKKSISGKILKFHVWMHLDVGDCSILLLGNCDLDL